MATKPRPYRRYYLHIAAHPNGVWLVAWYVWLRMGDDRPHLHRRGGPAIAWFSKGSSTPQAPAWWLNGRRVSPGVTDVEAGAE